MMSFIPASLLLICVINMASSQDCIDYGKMCSDDAQCCGGCCKAGVCTDTYRSCHDLKNPCFDHSCPPGLDCYVFTPENCPGCDDQAVCG